MTDIDKSHWQRVSAVLDELLDLAQEQRAARLASLRDADAAFAAEIEALLEAEAQVAQEGFLEQSPPAPLTVPGLAGQVIDRYTLERQLGEGGMGSVWLARRSDGRYEGQVAIKFLSMPAMGAAGLQRFEREGQVLARLQHPNIAHLLDAGVAPGGQPYLVLEYVQGEPIDHWCESRGASIERRIELFLQVLAAVSYAHGKLILHRDLKPSNILVTSEGQVKLLDFGIAKLLEEGGSAQETEMTKLVGRAFTLDYAAPEQIQGQDVSMATDVYSLGVLLYVVLTGCHPTAGNSLTPADRMRAVLDTEPRRASDAVAKTLPESLRARADERVRSLRGDLDNIAAKALKKSPADRYPTADAFAQDLRHYLNDEPVSARADSFAYRVRKFVTRHAIPVVAIVAVFIAVTAAALVSIYQAREAARQRDRALALSARNAAVATFVSGMLTEAAPTNEPIRMSELLDRSEQLLLSSATDPEHQAAILEMLAEYYLSTGNASRAEGLLDRALELAANGDPGLHATVLCSRGQALLLANDRDASLAALDDGLRLAEGDPLAAARCLHRRAFVAQSSNDAEGALRFIREAQAKLRESTLQRPDIDAALMAELGYASYLAGKSAEADRYYAQALASYSALGRAESPVTLTLRNNWAIASFAAGDNRLALENYDAALQIARKHNPSSDPPVYILSNRALALASLARYEEAFAAFEEALAASERTQNVATILHVLVNRAGTHLQVGQLDKAAQELDEIAARYGAMIPSDSVPGVTMEYLQARLALERGDPVTAEERLTGAIQFFDERNMQISPLTRALNSRAEAYRVMGKLDLARADAQRSIEIARALQDAKPHSSLTGLALLCAAEVEAAAGDTAKSTTLAREAAEHLRETLGTEHPSLAIARAIAVEN